MTQCTARLLLYLIRYYPGTRLRGILAWMEACPTNYLMPTCIWAFWHLTMHQALPIVYDGFVFLKPRYDNKPTICIWVILCSGSNTFPTNQMYIAPKLTWTSIECYQRRSKLCVFLVFYPWICHFFLWPRLRRGTFWPTICIRTWFDETNWPKPTNQTYMAAVSVSLLSKSNLPIVYDSPSRHFVGGANFPTIATWRERLLVLCENVNVKMNFFPGANQRWSFGPLPTRTMPHRLPRH